MLELRRHGDYKLADFWMKIFFIIFPAIAKTHHTVSVFTKTLYTTDKEPDDSVIVHELRHVEQYEEDGIKFLLGYVLSRQKRLLYEIDAYKVQGLTPAQTSDYLSRGGYLFWGWDKEEIIQRVYRYW